MNGKKFGRKIRTLRKAKTLAPYELAQLAGTTVQRISQIENQGWHGLDTFINLANALDVSLSQLVSEDEYKLTTTELKIISLIREEWKKEKKKK